MNVFVVGGTGVLGRRALPLLVADGHQVTAAVRSAAKADLVRELGATPVTLDLFDAAAVREAVAGHDVVCNLATHIPPLTKARSRRAWVENDRIRRDGSAHLVDAALAAGARRYIQESIAFLYPDSGDRWLDESTPMVDAAARPAVAAAEANAARFTAGGGVGVVLRFGMFYAPDSAQTQDQLRLARQGIAAVLGRADGYQSMVHLDDAAAAVVAALDAPAGVYHVTEDRPATRAVQAAAMAAALGVAPLWIPPAAAAAAGGPYAAPLAGSQRVSNRAFRAATRWAPRYPDPWTGWAAVAGPQVVPPGEHGRRILVRAALAYLALQAGLIGVWAVFAPSSWYRSFPGLGHAWVAASGPYDQHLVTDVGAFALALLVLTLGALAGQGRALVRLAGVAWVVSGLPHFLFHLTHQGTLGTGDWITSLVGLALQVVLGALCMVAAPPRRVPAPVSAPADLVAAPS